MKHQHSSFPLFTSSKTLLLVFCLLSQWLGTIAHGAEVAEPFDPNNVEINIQHGIALPWKKPGFRIEIGGWLPSEELSIHAISPSGKEISLVPTETPLHADADGNMIVDIDYEREGLVRGHWVILIAGKPGIHMIEIDIPLVEPPTKSNPNWKLTFGKQ